MQLSGAPARLLAALAAKAGARPAIAGLRSRPWASANFTGARHRLTLRFEGAHAAAAADRLGEGLAETEFALGRELLVDIALTGRQDAARGTDLVIEALVIDQD